MPPFFMEEYLIDEFKTLFYEPAGKNHYYLLQDLCKGKKLVFDVGTYKAASAIAMSTAKKVITFDIQKFGHALPDNVTQVVTGDFTAHTDVLKAEIILIDVDPHDGKQEKYFFDKLIEIGYKGMLIFDDIHLNKEMESFWKNITHPKEDVTEKGHYSGTGIVYL